MRLSIRWIFDHISQKLDWQSFNINDLVKLLNKASSEIEYVEHFKFDVDKFTIAKVLERSSDRIKVFSSEFNSEILLPERQDALVDSFYLVKRAATDKYVWASSSDFGLEKSYLVPAVMDDKLWKQNFEQEDYILVLDNKAISHRPDLWGHRGFAREVAALTGYDLKPLANLISTKPVEQCDDIDAIVKNGPFSIQAKQPNTGGIFVCKRYAGLYISEINNFPSDLTTASRLMRVDAKPIDYLVDLTNYVMFDLGQPMHAFDADKIISKKILIQSGYVDNNKLQLLDGSDIVLEPRDCAIYDDQNPIALAGIMGGSSTAVSSTTKSLFLESANFDGPSIRHTSMRLKKRTEASARFEKSLDPDQNVDAILRFLALLDQRNICYNATQAISSLGTRAEEKTIKIDADLIKRLLSMDIEPNVVTKILTKIGFGVEYSLKPHPHYLIKVPTFRGTKDVTIPVDIVEEIGRFIGYEAIELELPQRVMSAFDFKSVQNIREIKKHLAYGLRMNEVQSYAFFDEEFLRELHYEPGKTVEVVNPQSENWRRLVTSLVPNLIKVVNTNKHKQEQFRFFELNRIWRGLARSSLVNGSGESQSKDAFNALEAFELAGILVEQKRALNFYECKNIVSSLFEFLQINVKWRKLEVADVGKLEPWYYLYETAELTFDNQIIGLAGMADSRFLSKIIPEGSAFIFELNADFLINSRPEFKKFVPLEKYPEVHLDISILVPDVVAVHDVEKLIKTTKISDIDAKIAKVTLLDFFEKAEWGNKKSLTFRIALYDEHKTLVKTEVDQMYQAIVVNIEKLGGVVR